jgi:hypothetical protein
VFVTYSQIGPMVFFSGFVDNNRETRPGMNAMQLSFVVVCYCARYAPGRDRNFRLSETMRCFVLVSHALLTTPSTALVCRCMLFVIAIGYAENQTCLSFVEKLSYSENGCCFCHSWFDGSTII